MHQSLRVTWRVTPLQPPLVRRHCSRCSGETPFACSMKFRTNAQKKRIDVWLIYRCSACDETWNLPMFERVGIADLPPHTFDAIARNDSVLALRAAFDRRLLERHGVIRRIVQRRQLNGRLRVASQRRHEQLRFRSVWSSRGERASIDSWPSNSVLGAPVWRDCMKTDT